MSVAIEQRRQGHDVHIATLFAPEESFRVVVENHGVGLTSFNLTSFLKLPVVCFKFLSLIRKLKADVVHSHMYHSNMIARAVAPFYRKAIYVSTAHNIFEGGRFRDFMYRVTDPLADVTTNVSRAAVDRYNNDGLVRNKRCVLVPNGIDTHKFCRQSTSRATYRKQYSIESKFVWLAIASFTRQKDFPNLLLAFRELVDQGCADAKLFIAGSGPLEKEIKTLVVDLGLSAYVEILGARNDTPELYSMADAYVMSSAWEGLPIVLLEALSSSLPCVATNVGGNSELVKDNVTGFLVEPQNHRDLAEAMKNMMQCESKDLAVFGENGREYVEDHYGLSFVAKRWIDLYTAEIG